MTTSSPASCRSRTPVRLRELRGSDRAPLAALLDATGAFPAHEVAVALELIDLGITRRQDSAALRHDDYRFAVAEEESAGATGDGGARVVGYACWGWSPMTDGVLDLYWIAVDPAQQGGGVGKRLMAEVEADATARGARMVLAETGGKASYAPTRRFYERIGYVEIARLPDYFQVGDDKVVFARRFDGVALRAQVGAS